MLYRLLLTHLEEALGVHAAGLTGHPHAHESHSGTGIGVGGCRLHGAGLCADKMRRRAGGVHKGRIALQLLDHLFVFLVGLDAGNAEGYDLKTPKIPPLCGQFLVQSICQLCGVAWKGRVSNAHIADLCEGGLQRGQQLGFQLAVNGSAVKIRFHIAADIGIEQQRVCHPIGILPKTADGDINVDPRPLVHDTEGDGRGRAVLVADQFLGVEVVDALILGRFAAEGEPLADVLEHLPDTLPQVARKDAGFRGGVEGEFAGFSAYLHHLALLHDHHALAVGHGDHGAAGDNVVAAFGVAGAPGGPFPPLDRQHGSGDRLTVEILLPLIGHHAACRA